MDHFLWAWNRLKKVPPTGLQGYIIDTVKGPWLKVEVFGTNDGEKHVLTMIAGTGNNKEDTQSAMRASRWYDTILRAKKIKAKVEVVLPSYTGEEPPPAKGVQFIEAPASIPAATQPTGMRVVRCDSANQPGTPT